MIKNIIFDLGAVILEINLDAYVAELRKLAPQSTFEFDHVKHRFYSDYEKGIISDEAFFEKMSNALNGQLNITQLKMAWSKILLEPFEESKAFLDVVKDRYSLFLLSNTNKAHRQQFDEIFDSLWGQKVFYSYFKKAYYSYEMGLIKPNPKIFKTLIDNEGLVASETLFIDDNIDNVNCAKAIGINAWLFTAVSDWNQIMKKYNL